MSINSTDEAKHWYQYMTACTILNSWDSTTHALNGADKDGDLLFTTNNRVLVENWRPTPAIMCMQRNVEKIDVTEDDLIQSNINGFGDDIGKITNRVTSMFDVQAQFPPDSEEYKTLDYRIMCGQLYQQDAIDKIKGIVAKPMPKEWYDRATNRITETDSEEDIRRKEFNLSIIADKKPYFMRYIYPDLMSQYNTYTKNANKKCIREFRLTIDELLEKDQSERTDEENEFLDFYDMRMPVGNNDCVMNRICRRFEEEFDAYFTHNKIKEEFDHSFMKSGVEYSPSQYYSVSRLYDQYQQKLRDFMQLSKSVRVDEDEAATRHSVMIRDFRIDCWKVCSNASMMCDIILDLCYSKSGSKQFCWDICGEEIIDNLLSHNGNAITYPVQNENGDITYNGKKFSFEVKEWA